MPAMKKKDSPPQSRGLTFAEDETIQPLLCPLGCGHVFGWSISGWHHHAARYSAHPHWHSGVHDGAKRIALFRKEFPEFIALGQSWQFRKKRKEQRLQFITTGVAVPRIGPAAPSAPPKTPAPELTGDPLVDACAGLRGELKDHETQAQFHEAQLKFHQSKAEALRTALAAIDRISDRASAPAPTAAPHLRKIASKDR